MPKEIAEKLSATGLNVTCQRGQHLQVPDEGQETGQEGRESGSPGCRCRIRRRSRCGRHDLHGGDSKRPRSWSRNSAAWTRRSGRSRAWRGWWTEQRKPSTERQSCDRGPTLVEGFGDVHPTGWWLCGPFLAASCGPPAWNGPAQLQRCVSPEQFRPWAQLASVCATGACGTSQKCTR